MCAALTRPAMKEYYGKGPPSCGAADPIIVARAVEDDLVRSRTHRSRNLVGANHRDLRDCPAGGAAGEQGKGQGAKSHSLIRLGVRTGASNSVFAVAPLVIQALFVCAYRAALLLGGAVAQPSRGGRLRKGGIRPGRMRHGSAAPTAPSDSANCLGPDQATTTVLPVRSWERRAARHGKRGRGARRIVWVPLFTREHLPVVFGLMADTIAITGWCA